jgi:signal transduction histidine kinase
MVSAVPTARGLFTGRRVPGALIDATIAVTAFGGTLAVVAHGLGTGGTTSRHLDALGVLLAACASLPLLAWRRHALAVFAATTAASAALNLLGYPAGPPIGPTVALYLLAASRDGDHPWTRQTTVTVVGLFAAHFAAFAIGHSTIPGTDLAIGALVWAVAWFAGDRTRLRRAEIAELEQRAVRTEQEAERERRLAAAEERARIARDLHDSAAHAINVIAVQAGAARLLADRDPQRSRAALETIEEVARQTITDIDQIVRTLRDGTPADGRVEAPPGLAALGTLIADHARTGLSVTVRTEGRPRPLAGATDQAAYRILQEALTNAARHGTGSAEIVLTFAERALDLEIINQAGGGCGAGGGGAGVRGDRGARGGGAGGRGDRGAGAPAGGSGEGGGHGLVGMRERAALLGGGLRAEQLDGSFRIRAHLPDRGAVTRLPGAADDRSECP